VAATGFAKISNAGAVPEIEIQLLLFVPLAMDMAGALALGLNQPTLELLSNPPNDVSSNPSQ
jgi:hypothetical protein